MSVELGSVNPHMPNIQRGSLTGVHLAIIMVATAMIAADRYYCQPLLAEMSRTLHFTPSVTGLVPTLTQAGIAFGLLLLVPLGDTVELRRLILFLLFVLGCALAITAATTNAAMLFTGSLMSRLFASVSQLLVGLTATLAEPSRRGQVVGTVTAGLLLGVLSARTVAGLVGGAFGWRVMYLAAAVGMVVLTIIMALVLPPSRPSLAIAYPRLVRSLIALIREQRELREASVLGALAFAAMNAFWTTLVFFYCWATVSLRSNRSGSIRLGGNRGRSRCSNHRPHFRPQGATTCRLDCADPRLECVCLAACCWSSPGRLIGGILLLDLATQANLVSNQTRIYSLLPDAANRFNTIYMSSYFAGGAAIGSLAWQHFGWTGLCALGLALFATALVVLARSNTSPLFRAL
jgi:predicted MFS family arabinose efflux permease